MEPDHHVLTYSIMKITVIFFCLAFATVGVVAAEHMAEKIHFDPTIGDLVLNTSTFSAIPHGFDKRLLRREAPGPECCDKYGRASLTETANNIRHLSDVKDEDCDVPAASCARVSHDGRSSIFSCNFDAHSIHPKCGDLIQPAQDVSDACQQNSLYTYGWVNKTVQNELGTVTFWVVLADDFMFDDL